MPRLRYIPEKEKTPHTHELIESAKRTGAPDPLLIRNGGSPKVNASKSTEKSEAKTATALKAEVDEAIASCGGDIRHRVAGRFS
jgi:hypothetical protein